ncbi:MAG: hypothetical protein ACK4N5_04680 [Myxococcales bacterium]
MGDFVTVVGIVGTSLGALTFLARYAARQEATARDAEIVRWRREADRKIQELEFSIGARPASPDPRGNQDRSGQP